MLAWQILRFDLSYHATKLSITENLGYDEFSWNVKWFFAENTKEMRNTSEVAAMKLAWITDPSRKYTADFSFLVPLITYLTLHYMFTAENLTQKFKIWSRPHVSLKRFCSPEHKLLSQNDQHFLKYFFLKIVFFPPKFWFLPAASFVWSLKGVRLPSRIWEAFRVQEALARGTPKNDNNQNSFLFIFYEDVQQKDWYNANNGLEVRLDLCSGCSVTFKTQEKSCLWLLF